MRPLTLSLAFGVLATLACARSARAEYTLWPAPPPEERPVPAADDLVTRPVAAQPPSFSSPGTVLIDASAGAGTSHVGSLQSVASLDIGYFFRERMSLGIELWGSTFRYYGANVTAYGIGPRAGYVVPLGGSVFLYPTALLVLGTMHVPHLAPAPPDTTKLVSGDTRRGLAVEVDVPVLVRLGSSLLLGPALSVRQDLTRFDLDPVYATDRPNVAGLLMIGGWLPVGETVRPTASAYDHMPL